MKYAVRALFIVSITLNLVAGFLFFQNKVPQQLESDLPYQDNLTDFINFVDGYFSGISQDYKYYERPTYCPGRDPINNPESPFDEGYSRAIKMSEKKCENAFDLKVKYEESTAEMIRTLNASYIRCEENYEELYEEYTKIDRERIKAIKHLN